MADADFLVKLHGEVMAAIRNYRPPASLVDLLDEEYAGYVLNTTTGSLYYQWLALTVRMMKPALVVELGTGLGVSTLLILSELRATGRLVTCDLVPRPKFVPPTVMSDLRVRFVVGNDLDLSTFGDELPVGIDLLLIDTDHTYAQVSAEWRIYRHLCRPGALVVLDDINMNDMRRFWDSLSYPKLDLTAECHLSGFGIFRYETAGSPQPLRARQEALGIASERLVRVGTPNRGVRRDRGIWRWVADTLGFSR